MSSRNWITAGSLVVAMSTFAGAAPAGDMPGEGKTVTPARASWDTFWFGGTVLQVALEKLGYTVEDPKTLNNPARYPALAAGDIDYETDTVMPNATAFVEKVSEQVVLLGPVMNPGSIQGYLVDRKTADANGITSVDDLKKPEVVKLFDSDNDGKAELTGCNPGWNCEGIINHHIGVYGLGDTVEHIQGEYNVLVGDAVARYKAGESVLLYAWYPNTATVQMLPDQDLVWLQVSHTDLPSGKKDTSLPGIQGCAGGADPCNTGWSATEYYVAANREWLADNPAAAKLFEMARIGLEDRVVQNIAMKNGEDSEKDLRRHAEEWIDRNQAEFDGWIAAARAASN
ncbi:MAG: glycine betaine/L-proline ABC transporter substrate-binding protein ProX [Thiotrichales bacterium]|nr:glycine betaine/L-proline ABC transporter substrate-binding protein ProX [Thiotrichales bacterium]